MKEQNNEDYAELKNFWNTVSAIDEETKKEDIATVDKENDWKELAPSKKIHEAAATLGDKEHVLDYGCGIGWATLIMAKSGAKHIVAAEMAENALDTARFYAELFEVDKSIEFVHISDTWLDEENENKYDGVFCSNVLDVVPTEVAENIICNLAKVAKNDANIIIGLNFYQDTSVQSNNPNQEFKGNYVYNNGILRMVSRTDEEWAEMFGKHFTVEKLDHFAWNGEEKERRRLFYLKKKCK